MAKRTQSQYLRLVSTAKIKRVCAKTGVETEEATGTVYVTKRNPRTAQEQGKFEFMKYDPIVRQHVVFKEAKMK